MKINFKRTMLWRLVLYFFIVIVITVTIVILFSKMRPENAKITQNEQDFMMRARLVTELAMQRIHLTGNPELSDNFYSNLGFISRTFIRFYNKNGKQVGLSRKQPPELAELMDIRPAKKQLDDALDGLPVTAKADFKQRRELMKLDCLLMPVFYDGKQVGVLFILNFPPPPKPRRPALSSILIQGIVITVLIALGASILLSLSFLKPISKIERAAKEISKGNFSSRLQVNSNDELGSLSETINTMSGEIERNIKARIKLLGDITHELNTPLAAIKLNTEAMIDRVIEDEEEREQALYTILNQIQRASFLLEDLTELSKFEAGVIALNFESFKANEVIEAVVRADRMYAEKKNVNVEFEPIDEDVSVKGDPLRIQQVVHNLVNNAIKHNPEGTRVVISIYREKMKVYISVKDNGRGIPKEELKNIFERFHQVISSKGEKAVGSGLGLSIVKFIVEAHGSEILVESSGKGTGFVFALPMIDRRKRGGGQSNA